jgi:hypothetical protein
VGFLPDWKSFNGVILSADFPPSPRFSPRTPILNRRLLDGQTRKSRHDFDDFKKIQIEFFLGEKEE